MRSVGSVLDGEKSQALLRFVVAIGTKAEIRPVNRLVDLGERHVPMLAGTIYKKDLLFIEKPAHPSDAYRTAKEVLVRTGSNVEPDKYLDEHLAASGDDFEICKFLVALLNDFRFAYPAAFGEDPSISDQLDVGDQRRIVNMMKYLEDPEAWDETQSWQAVLTERYPSPYGTPRTALARAIFSSGSWRQSPLSEAVSSPVARANIKLREKDKKNEELQERLNEKEFECDELERKNAGLEQSNKKLTGKLEALYCKDGEFMTLRRERDNFQNQLSSVEKELERTKEELRNQRSSLALKEEHIVMLQRCYDESLEDAEDLRSRLSERDRAIRRLKEDLEISDMALQTEKTQQATLERNTWKTRQKLEEEFEEMKKMYRSEKVAAQNMKAEHEEALISWSNRAKQLSADLAVSTRRLEELENQHRTGLCNILQETGVMRSDLHSVRTEIKTAKEDVEQLFARSSAVVLDHCRQASVDCKKLQQLPSTSNVQTSGTHPVIMPDDEDDCSISKSICGPDFEVRRPAQAIDTTSRSLRSDRYRELHKRSKMAAPHLHACCCPEVTAEDRPHRFEKKQGWSEEEMARRVGDINFAAEPKQAEQPPQMSAPEHVEVNTVVNVKTPVPKKDTAKADAKGTPKTPTAKPASTPEAERTSGARKWGGDQCRQQ